MYHTLEELKILIAAKLSIEDIMDILGWEIPELLNAIEDDIDLYAEEFEEAIKD